MKNFKNKVAVITGGASGLGKAMAHKFSNLGMKIVIADIEEKSLNKTLKVLRENNQFIEGMNVDVTNEKDMQLLADFTLKKFGEVNLLCNNAGVSTLARIWEHSLKETQWAINVNIIGVMNGIRIFTPLLIKQKSNSHIVNTASVAGLLSFSNMGLYSLTKHAVVTITESLHHDLGDLCNHVKCSVLCPAFVPTRIFESHRNKPKEFQDSRVKSKENITVEEKLEYAVKSGKITAEQVADKLVEGLYKEDFYILTHEKIKPAVKMRSEEILENKKPTNSMQNR